LLRLPHAVNAFAALLLTPRLPAHLAARITPRLLPFCPFPRIAVPLTRITVTVPLTFGLLCCRRPPPPPGLPIAAVAIRFLPGSACTGSRGCRSLPLYVYFGSHTPTRLPCPVYYLCLRLDDLRLGSAPAFLDCSLTALWDYGLFTFRAARSRLRFAVTHSSLPATPPRLPHRAVLPRLHPFTRLPTLLRVDTFVLHRLVAGWLRLHTRTPLTHCVYALRGCRLLRLVAPDVTPHTHTVRLHIRCPVTSYRYGCMPFC